VAFKALVEETRNIALPYPSLDSSPAFQVWWHQRRLPIVLPLLMELKRGSSQFEQKDVIGEDQVFVARHAC